ncbi:MAG: DNA methyltransferase, partial [Planctomycetota bacterium]
EGTAGLDSPRAGAGRTASKVKNFHPTVKPRKIFERLLDDVPLDVPVGDNFVGSGSCAIACLETGHDFVGMEREAEYLEIADARSRHWNAKLSGHGGKAVIESDVEGASDEIEIDEAPESDTCLMDLFWGGGE